MRRLLLPVLFALLALASASLALAATITVDGDPSDWSTISPATTDPDEVAVPNDRDIDEVYFTNDSSDLFWRLDTVASPTRWAPVGLSSPYVFICMNVDSDLLTGATVTQCDNQQGVDYVLDVRDTTGNSQPNVRLFDCTSGSCVLSGSTPTVGFNGGNTTEVGLSLAAIGVTDAATCAARQNILSALYFDGVDVSPDDNVPDSEVFTASLDCTPLAITLGSFSAALDGADVVLSWETISEIDNVGFNIHRAESATATPVQVNTALIPSQAPGSGQGAAYQWRDTGLLVEGQEYFYWLEDVDGGGATSRHGPVSITYGAPTAVQLDTLSATATPVPPVAALALALVVIGALAATRQRGFVRR